MVVRSECHRESKEIWVLVLDLSLNSYVMLSKSLYFNSASAMRCFEQYDLKILDTREFSYNIFKAPIKIYFKAESLKLKKWHYILSNINSNSLTDSQYQLYRLSPVYGSQTKSSLILGKFNRAWHLGVRTDFWPRIGFSLAVRLWVNNLNFLILSFLMSKMSGVG